MSQITPRLLALAAALQLGCACAFAQQAAEPDSAGLVRVIDLGAGRDPDLRPYSHMLKGAQAFERHHGLAPQAALRFVLRPDSSNGTLDGVTLGIGDHNRSMPVSFGADGVFTLPLDVADKDDEADLVTNRRRKSIRWSPHIHSPGVPADRRRLGDLRLHCEVFAAVIKAGVPAQLQQQAAARLPDCASPKLVLNFAAARPLTGATLVSGARRLALPISNRGGFAAPLADRGWDDEALVEFVYAAPAQPE
jgi:hypothetical protein